MSNILMDACDERVLKAIRFEREASAKRIADLEADNAALRQLLADMKPHWDGFTRKVIWTAQMAGVMADLRTRLDAAKLAGKEKP